MIEANQQTEPTVEKQSNTEGPQVLKVSQILMDLDSGLGRPQIKEKYSLTLLNSKRCSNTLPSEASKACTQQDQLHAG